VHQNGEESGSTISYFEHGVVVGVRWAGLSEPADLLGCSCASFSREWFEKEKISSEGQFCGSEESGQTGSS